MKIGDFEIPSWNEPRRPMADEEADRLRRGRYWTWCDSNGPNLGDGSPRTLLTTSSSGRWVRIETATQADFEAFRMRHSIGYDFDRYASMGKVYSLRDADGASVMTILVADGIVVHARGPANAALDDAACRSLISFATTMRWEVAERTTL